MLKDFIDVYETPSPAQLQSTIRICAKNSLIEELEKLLKTDSGRYEQDVAGTNKALQHVLGLLFLRERPSTMHIPGYNVFLHDPHIEALESLVLLSGSWAQAVTISTSTIGSQPVHMLTPYPIKLMRSVPHVLANSLELTPQATAEKTARDENDLYTVERRMRKHLEEQLELLHAEFEKLLNRHLAAEPNPPVGIDFDPCNPSAPIKEPPTSLPPSPSILDDF